MKKWEIKENEDMIIFLMLRAETLRLKHAPHRNRRNEGPGSPQARTV